jgi:hypothetical protein
VLLQQQVILFLLLYLINLSKQSNAEVVCEVKQRWTEMK